MNREENVTQNGRNWKRGDWVNNKDLNEERITLIGPYITFIMSNILFFPMLIMMIVASFFYLSILECLMGMIIPTFLYILMNFLLLHYWGKNTPTDIRITQSKIIIKYFSPFKQDRTILKKNMQVIEFGREIRSIIPRYAVAFITYRGIYYAYRIPNRVLKTIESKWSDVNMVHSTSSMWVFSSYIYGKYRHMIGKQKTKHSKDTTIIKKNNKKSPKNLLIVIVSVFMVIILTIVTLFYFSSGGIPSISLSTIIIIGCPISILLFGISIPFTILYLQKRKGQNK